MKIFLGSDTLLYLKEFHNTKTGVAITSGTVVAKLYDIEAPAVQVGPDVTLSHDGSGTWSGTIADTHAGLKVGMRVRVALSADGGAGLMCFKDPVMTVVGAK